MRVVPIVAAAMFATIFLFGASHAHQSADQGTGEWDDNNDYPLTAWREGREGTTGFRLTYDWEGKITHCEIISTSGHTDLDDAACRLVRRRGSFKPRPTGSQPLQYTNRIVWVIPKAIVPAYGQASSYFGSNRLIGSMKENKFYPEAARNEKREGTTAFRATYDWRGKIVSCEVTSSSGHADLDAATCTFVREHGEFKKRPKDSPPIQFNNWVKWVISRESAKN